MSRDWGFCRFLTLEIGVAAIPPSAFYEEKDRGLAANMARFAFCKEDATLHEAAARLQGLRKYLTE
jgi:aspartate/methionine/tyrosine aminotransferase